MNDSPRFAFSLCKYLPELLHRHRSFAKKTAQVIFLAVWIVQSSMQLEHKKPDPHEVTDEERMDEAMAESFPASDAPSWTSGLSHEQKHSTEPAKFPWKGNWNEVKRKLMQKFASLTDEDLFYQEGKEDELMVRLQKKLSMTREEIEDVLSK